MNAQARILKFSPADAPRRPLPATSELLDLARTLPEDDVRTLLAWGLVLASREPLGERLRCLIVICNAWCRRQLAKLTPNLTPKPLD